MDQGYVVPAFALHKPETWNPMLLPQVRAMCAPCLICLRIVSVLPDFAVSLDPMFASHIKLTTVLLQCVSSTRSGKNMLRTCGTLLSRLL